MMRRSRGAAHCSASTFSLGSNQYRAYIALSGDHRTKKIENSQDHVFEHLEYGVGETSVLAMEQQNGR
jgi:hypothetical protein